jgi:hypothetical protein
MQGLTDVTQRPDYTLLGSRVRLFTMRFTGIEVRLSLLQERATLTSITIAGKQRNVQVLWTYCMR